MKKVYGLLLLFVTVVLFFLSVKFFDGGKKLTELSLDEEDFEVIKESREWNSELLPVISFDEEVLSYAGVGETFFYSLVEGNKTAFDPKVKVLFSDEKLNIAFLKREMGPLQIAKDIRLPFVVYTDNTYKEYEVCFTTLPVMSISVSETIDEEEINMQLHLFDNQKGAARRDITSDGTIRIRGANSKMFPQPGYKLSLTTKSLGDNKRPNRISLLGLRKDDDWILGTVFADTEKVRMVYSNRLWTKTVSRNNKNNIDTGVDFRNVELIVNGEYYGLYALGYTIDDKQLGMGNDFSKEALYKKILWYDETNLAMSQWGVMGYSQKSDSTDYGEDINDASWELILEYYYQLWRNTDNPEMLYKGIDLDNAIDIMLYFNLIQGVDNVRNNLIKNLYMAISEEDGIYKALYCPWDVDITWGSTWCGDPDREYIFSYSIPEDYNCMMENGYLYAILANGDKELVNKIYNRYRDLRNNDWSDKVLMDLADELETEVYGSGAFIRENQRWPESPVEPECDEGLDKFRSYVLKRAKECDDYMERFHNLGEKHSLFVLKSAKYKDFKDRELTIGINNKDVLNETEYKEFFEYLNIDISKITDKVKTVKGSANKGYQYLEKETEFTEVFGFYGDGNYIAGPKDIVMCFDHAGELQYFNFTILPEFTLDVDSIRDPYLQEKARKMID